MLSFFFRWCMALLSVMAVGSCASPSVPSGNVEDAGAGPAIVPDYTGIVMPPNIAPLNFEIDMEGDEYVVRAVGAGGKSLTAGGKTIRWDEDDWHELLEASKGGQVEFEVYVRSGDSWRRYDFVNTVAGEEIDRYITYRLIEPSYEHFSGLTINQRDLTCFDESVVWNNPAPCNEQRGYCINCHVPRNHYRDHASLFHTRGAEGGTFIMAGDSVVKVDLKTDSTISAGVYPAWHPNLDIVAFSTNGTAQKFPARGRQKAEVFDAASDLILYDMKTHEISNIAADPALLETYPCWSPDGDMLYYSVAAYPDGVTPDNLGEHTEKIRYDIVRRSFDRRTRTFSDADTVVSATSGMESVLLPRVSPDGRFLLYCKAPFGSFHIWHEESDLYVTDLKTGEERALSKANSPRAESYHSWSSNSRWIVFSSRRDDGSYTRPYIAYVDKEGKDSKAFVMPQEDPGYYSRLMKSYNVPEFLADPVAFSRSDIVDHIREAAVQARQN